MKRQMQWMAALAVMTVTTVLALNTTASAQIYERPYPASIAQTRQCGYDNGYRDGVARGQHEGRENDPYDYQTPDWRQATRGTRPGWVLYRFFSRATNRDTRPASNPGLRAFGLKCPTSAVRIIARPVIRIATSRTLATPSAARTAPRLHAKICITTSRSIRIRAAATAAWIAATGATSAIKATTSRNTIWATAPATRRYTRAGIDGRESSRMT